MHSIATLLDAWNGADRRAALDEALSLWRTTRQPRLADAVDVWSRTLEPSFPTARTKAEFQTQWLQVASEGDPRAFGWLARTIDHLVEVSTGRRALKAQRFQALFARFDLLARLRPDPRISAGLVAVLRRGRFPALEDMAIDDPAAIYGPMIQLVAKVGDRRAIEPLRALLATPRSPHGATQEALARHLPVALKALEAIEPLPLAGLERFQFEPSEPAPLAGSLLAEIRSNPDDPELLAIYADLLQQAGDPRGTLIALQLADDDESRRAARALLKVHQRDWLGPLADVLSNVRFVAGFPRSATVTKRRIDDTALFVEAGSAPDLASVTDLRLGPGYGHHYLPLAFGPACRLHHLDVPKRWCLEEIPTLSPRLTVTAVTLGFPPRADDVEGLAALLPQVPNARALHVKLSTSHTPDGLQALRASGWLDRIDRLELEGHGQRKRFETDEALKAPVEAAGLAWSRTDATMIAQRI